MIHLSTTTNYIPSLDDKYVQDQLLQQMQRTVDTFRNQTNGLDGQALFHRRLKRPRPRMINTVVIIPYSGTPASQGLNPKQYELVKFTHNMRLKYLQACVYSVSRYFPKIIVSTGNEIDRQAVESLSLPIWKLINVEHMIQNQMMKLQQMSLIYLYEQIMNNTESDWRKVQYIYFTEMDQVLHLRVLSLLYSLLDSSNHRLIMVPHRMNVNCLHLFLCYIEYNELCLYRPLLCPRHFHRIILGEERLIMELMVDGVIRS